jgi:outer membrane receptor protein involved in Fe transport
MNKIDMRRLVASAVACVCASPEFAAGQDTTQLQEVVVTASRSPELLQEVPASVTVITAEQIRDTPAQGLDDILQLVPGMNLTQMGPDVGHPTAYNEGMRGLPTTETRFLVLVDGIPVNDPFFGYIQWNRIPLDNIERVEIVRGGGAPLWGNGAMGGVINIITRTPSDSMLDVDAAGGSYGTYRTSVYGAYRASNALVLSMNSSFSGTNGYQTTPASWTTYGTTTLRSPLYIPTSFDARNISLRADYTPSTDLTGFFIVNYYDDDQVLTTPIGDDSQQTWSYSGQLSKTFQNNGALTATVFHNDSNFVTNNPHLLSFTSEYNSNIHNSPGNDTGGSLTWTQDLSSILKSYTFGVDAHQITGSDYSNYYLPSGAIAVPTIVGSGKQLFVGGFAETRLEPIEHLEISGSVRYQYYRNYDGIDTFPPAIGAIPASSKKSVDPRLDIRYALTDEFALRGAYYKSFRAPTLDQLYRTYADTTAGIYEGNPFLKPETLKGGEVGLDFNHDGFRSQLTFYDTTITNLITQRNLTPAENPTALGVVCGYDATTYTYLTCTRLINAASAVARGMELEADWNLGHGVSAGFGYTYADSHYTSNPEDPTAVGQRLEGVPKQNVSGRLAYAAPAGWRIATDLRWVSKSYGDAHPQDNLIQNAHFVMDVSGSYPLTQRLQAYIQIQNLTDTRYIANNSGAAPILGTPREVIAGLHLRLD